jgi:thiamine biosynthesis lipoprotein
MGLSPDEELRSHAREIPADHTDRQRKGALAPARADPWSDSCHHGHNGDHGRRRRPRRPRGECESLSGPHVFVIDVGRQERRGAHLHHDVRTLEHRHDGQYGYFFLFRLENDHHHDIGAQPELLVGHRDLWGDLVMPALDVLEPTLTTRSFRAIGTTATVVVQDHADADEAVRALAAELRAIDATCSRFRPDSELQSLHAEAGRTVAVSTLLFEALSVAHHAAERTGGAVDPTVGNALAALGYDADLNEVRARPPGPPKALGPVAGYQHVQLDPRHRTVRIPRGVRLDLGSTAKAWAADRAAARIARRIGAGALVSLGGDVAVAGPPPPGGWAIGVARASSTPPAAADQVVAIRRGGLASSGTTARTWKVGDRAVHHIVDPRSGDCVEPYWDVVSATGSSCVEANTVTTAAIVWGARALDELPRFEQAVRLVRADGHVIAVNGWPSEAAA